MTQILMLDYYPGCQFPPGKSTYRHPDSDLIREIIHVAERGNIITGGTASIDSG